MNAYLYHFYLKMGSLTFALTYLVNASLYAKIVFNYNNNQVLKIDKSEYETMLRDFTDDHYLSIKHIH